MAVLSIALLPDLVEAAGDHNAGRLTGRLPEEASDGPGHDVGVLAPGGHLGAAQAGSSSWSDGAPLRNTGILCPGVQHCIGVLIFSNFHSLVPRLVVICVALAYLLPLFGNLFLRLNVVRTPPFVTFFSSQFLYLISVLPNCHTFGTFLDGVSLNDGGFFEFFLNPHSRYRIPRYVII